MCFCLFTTSPPELLLERRRWRREREAVEHVVAPGLILGIENLATRFQVIAEFVRRVGKSAGLDECVSKRADQIAADRALLDRLSDHLRSRVEFECHLRDGN